MNKKLFLGILIFILGLSNCAQAKMSKEAYSLYQKACNLEEQRRYPETIELLLKALQINGDDTVLYTKLAGIYKDLGEPEKALEIYKKVVELNPNDSFIYISIGDTLRDMGNYSDALKCFQKSLQLFPEYKYNYKNMADVQFQMNDYQNANNNYNIFLEAYPSHQDARENLAYTYLKLNNPQKAVVEYKALYTTQKHGFKEFGNYGQALYKTGDYNSAVEMLNKALEFDNEDITSTAYLALSYQKLQKNDLALENFEKAFKLNPDFALLRIDYGDLLFDTGKPDLALKEYETYAKAFPKDPSGYIGMASVYEKKNDINNALSNYLKAINLDNKNTDALKGAAKCYHMQQNYPYALKYYEQALETEPDNQDLLTNKAIVLHANGELDSAIKIYKIVLKNAPNKRIKENLIDAINTKGDNAIASGKYSDAIITYNEALEEDINNDYAYYGLGSAYERMGNTVKAVENYEKAISINPDEKIYLSAYENIQNKDNSQESIKQQTLPIKSSENLLLKEGDDLYKSQQFNLAIDKFNQALEQNPNNASIYLRLGNCYKALRDATKSSEAYQNAIKISPKYPDAWFNLGLVYAETGNYSDCEKCFSQVTALDPNYTYAYYALGMTYEKLQNKEKAISNYEKYISLSKDEKTKQTIELKVKALRNSND